MFSSAAVISSNIIADSPSGTGVIFRLSPLAQIIYCDISGNSDGPFSYYQNDTSNAPLAIGIIALTNAIGDSCDTYYNIYQDPMFVDTANGDHHLRAESPCIDAGDPALPHDPDGTVADIGAFYYPHPATTGRTAVRPYSFDLRAFPNPFNATTRITFDLPRAANVTLDVYDITGRLAASLVSGRMNAGKHDVAFDGANLASGVYFARIHAGELVRTQRLVLLK